MVERFDLVQYEHFDQLDRAVNGDWVRYSDHEAELSALKKQVEELTKALEFYADVSKYPAPLTGGMGDLWADCGQIARAALTSTRETGK